MNAREAKQAAAEAAARDARLHAILALRPARLSAEVEIEWQALAGTLADDPPSWAPSRRYAALLNEYCIERVNERQLRLQLATPAAQLVRETTPSGAVKVKVSPFVPLLEASLKRLRELTDMLELSPRGARQAKRKIFDAA